MKYNIADVVIVSDEGLEALVVIIKIPQFYAQVGRATNDITSLRVIIDVVNWV